MRLHLRFNAKKLYHCHFRRSRTIAQNIFLSQISCRARFTSGYQILFRWIHSSNCWIIYYGLISNFRRLGAITSSSLGVICFACIIIIKKLLALSKDRYRNNWHSFFLHTTCVKHISSHNWGSAKKVEFLWNWSLRLHM